MDPVARDALVAAFRKKLYARVGYVPFAHQAEWQLATEGRRLLPMPPPPGCASTPVLIYERDQLPEEPVLDRRTINGFACAVVARATVPRPGGAAHVAIDMGGYKIGKSFSTAHWAAGFAIVPGAKVQFVGLEYGTSEHEFNYLLEALLSARGLGMQYSKLHNDKRGGRMILVLKATGAAFEVKSWNQKEALKGDKITAYCFTEAYQLPGIEVYNTNSQNLRELRGFAQFSTTADRPWVGVFHKYGHGVDPDWHCTCGVNGSANPFTFDPRARDRDDPKLNGLMTKERFAISWEGKLGAFIGRVYDFQQGQRQFSPASHPVIWNTTRLSRDLADATPSGSPAGL